MYTVQIKKCFDFFLLNTFTNYYAFILCLFCLYYFKSQISEVLFLRDQHIKNNFVMIPLLSLDVCHLFPNREFWLTFFCRTQWKMNINIPCRELKMVKRYAMMTVLSLIYMSPKAQVNPKRQRRAIAPITHDLQREEKIKGFQIISL